MSGTNERAFHCPACRLRDPKHDKPLCRICWGKVLYETQQLWWRTMEAIQTTPRERIDLARERRSALVAVLAKAVEEVKASAAVAS